MKKSFGNLIKQTISEWQEDKAPRLAAAMAYYTAFSLAPILVISIAVIGLIYDRQVAQERIVGQIGSLAGPDGADLINTMLEASQDTGTNIVASIVGFVVLLFGAAGVFGQLQDALNTMWEVVPRPKPGLLGAIRSRFLSFTMVVGVGFLLLVSLVVSALLTALQDWTVGLFPGFEFLMQVVNFIVSFLIVTLLFALLFKYVPDAEIRWRDVWLGAAVTAFLFTIGKLLIGLYLGNGDTAEKFGAAGSLVVLLLWVYYTAQISFLGAEFTQTYANMYGSKVVPDEDAVPLTEEARVQQGMPRQGDLRRAAQTDTSVSKQAKPSTTGQAGPLSSTAPAAVLSYRPTSPREDERQVRKAVAVFAWMVLALGGVIGYLVRGARPKS